MCTSAAEQQDSMCGMIIAGKDRNPNNCSSTEEAGWKTPSGDVYGLYPTSPLYIPLPRDRSLELSGAGNRSRVFNWHKFVLHKMRRAIK